MSGDVNKHSYCIDSCDIGKQLKKHGDKLLSLSREKAENILSKGKDMTTNDIKYLLERGYFKQDIAKHMGLSKTRARHILRDINPRGLPKQKIRKVERPGESIRDKVFRMLDAGMTIHEIKASKNFKTSTVNTYYSHWNTERKADTNGLGD